MRLLAFKFFFTIFFICFLVNSLLYASVKEDYIQYLKYQEKLTSAETEYLNAYYSNLSKKQAKRIFLGLVLGTSLGFNLEWVFIPAHSLITEASYSLFYREIATMYRLYFKKHTDSYFIDFLGRWVLFEMDFTNPFIPPFYMDDVLYKGKITATLPMLGLHIGKKWLWSNGLFVTLRGGYSYIVDFSNSNNQPIMSTPMISPRTYEDFASWIPLFFSINIKLTLGWAF